MTGKATLLSGYISKTLGLSCMSYYMLKQNIIEMKIGEIIDINSN